MSPVNNVGSPSTQFTPEIQFDPKTPSTGAGAIGESGEAPPAPQPQTVADALASLSSFMSGGAGVDVDVLLVQIAVAMRDAESATQKEKIETDSKSKELQLKEKQDKLDEAQKKMDEAEAKRKSASIWDKIKLAFEWIGAAIAAALAVVMIATGVGAVVGAALLVAAVAAIVMAVDSTVQMATGMGIAGNLAYIDAKARGQTDEQAKDYAAKADMGFRISMAVIGIVATIVAGGAGSAGAFKAAVDAGRAASGIKDTIMAAKTAFFEVLRTANQALTQTAQMARKGLEIATAVNSLGTAATNAGSTVTRSQATEASGEAKRLEGKAKENEAIIQMLDDLIDQALSRLMASSDRFNAILDDIVESMNDRGNTMSKARFAG